MNTHRVVGILTRSYESIPDPQRGVGVYSTDHCSLLWMYLLLLLSLILWIEVVNTSSDDDSRACTER
jgi:hypothetical protein